MEVMQILTVSLQVLFGALIGTGIAVCFVHKRINLGPLAVCLVVLIVANCFTGMLVAQGESAKEEELAEMHATVIEGVANERELGQALAMLVAGDTNKYHFRGLLEWDNELENDGEFILLVDHTIGGRLAKVYYRTNREKVVRVLVTPIGWGWSGGPWVKIIDNDNDRIRFTPLSS